jgi:5-formyltetrahydrofolate cyclo-ligase
MSVKDDIRLQINSLKKNYSPEFLNKKSERIGNQIELHTRFKQAKYIMMYYPLPGEASLIPLIEAYYTEKEIFLPSIKNEDIILKKYEGENRMIKGKFNIYEPEGEEWKDFSLLELIIVPGIAFDIKGHRLGRGKGYYDRFLSKIINVYKIGVCFDFQLLPSIPIDKNDIKVDEVIFG